MRSRLAKGVSAAALLATLGLAGCSGGDDDNSAFIGTYMYLTGTRTLTCPTLGGQETSQLTGTLTISKGIDAPLVVVLPSGCTLKMDPAGMVATLRPMQVCPPQTINIGGAAATETDTHQGGNVTVTGTSAVIAESGSAQLVGGNGATAICTFTMNGTLNKVSK
jgi:hypothetical protein